MVEYFILQTFSATAQTANTVLKVWKDHHYGDRNLINDYYFHLKTYRDFDNQMGKIWRLYNVHIPTPFEFKPNSYNPLLPKSGTELVTRDTLTEGYIPPVPACVRHALLQDFEGSDTSIHDQITNHDCLIRPYLGKERDQRTPPRRAFSLRNDSLCINDSQQLALFDDDDEEGSLSTAMFLSEVMSAALATLHFAVNCDACDIEFVLGGRPVVPKSQCPPDMAKYVSMYSNPDCEMYLWLLEFNHCNPSPGQSVMAKEASSRL